jgi:hypothetical protein
MTEQQSNDIDVGRLLECRMERLADGRTKWYLHGDKREVCVIMTEQESDALIDKLAAVDRRHRLRLERARSDQG